MNFTARQLNAVDVSKYGQDACIVAGPGSGKTTVLVEYFQRLVQNGVDPLRILAITFTEKAANNMQEKLARAFQDRADLRGKLERAYVSTVHGFCMRLLRENAIFAGIDPDFCLLDEQESLSLERRALNEALDGLFAEDPERARLMRGLASSEFGSALLGAYEAMRAAGIAVMELARFRVNGPVQYGELLGAVRELRAERPVGWSSEQLTQFYALQEAGEQILEAEQAGPKEKLAAIAGFNSNLNRLKRNNGAYDLVRRIAKELIPEVEYSLVTEYYARERQTLIAILARFDRLYRERKQQLGGLDYADLEENAVRLLAENPDVRRRVHAQFDQILMDEFQDTNDQQAKLLELLRPPDRFYAVGDINQSIYGFRHADPDVFRAYRDRVQNSRKHLVELVENFRSRPDILRMVETVLDRAQGIEHRPLVAKRVFPESAQPCVEVLSAIGADAEQSLALEARWVARRILDFEGSLRLAERSDQPGTRPAEFKDMAVLVRNSEVMSAFTDAFDEFHIPYLVNRGKGFYETRVVVDCMHLLRVLVNPRDEVSIAAVLRSPFVEVSDEALLRLKQMGNLGSAIRRLNPEHSAGFHPDDREKLERFHEQLLRWRANRDYVCFDRLLLRALDESGYQCESGPRGAANLEKFLAQARNGSSRQSLAEFVEELEDLRASNPREADAPPEDSANAVKIMTVHSAKGLEFPIVFLAALHKGVDQSLGGVSFSQRLGLGARWRNPVTGKDKDDVFQHAIRRERGEKEQSESNRLFYVAMTRAEERLVLSFSAKGNAKQWAGTLKESLGLDLDTPRDAEIATVTASDGRELQIRVLCTDLAPERPPRPGSSVSEEPVPFLPRPLITDQHDSNANVTSLAIFAQCPRRYYLSRYLGWEGRTRAPEAQDAHTIMDASEFGQQVHAILAGGRLPSPHPDAVRLAETFRRSPLGQRAARASVIEREFDFLLSLEDVVLRGQIDLWFEEDGELVVVDYKTDEVTAPEAAQHAQGYALQLRLYALALERLSGRVPDKAYIYFLRPDVAIAVDFDHWLPKPPEQVLRDFRQAQSTLTFPLNEAEHCQRCPYLRGLCPAGL